MRASGCACPRSCVRRVPAMPHFGPGCMVRTNKKLPAQRELMQVLWELDIYPNLEMYAPIHFQTIQGLAAGSGHCEATPCFKCTPDTEHDAAAGSSHARPELLIETSAGYVIKRSTARAPGAHFRHSRPPRVNPYLSPTRSAMAMGSFTATGKRANLLPASHRVRLEGQH